MACHLHAQRLAFATSTRLLSRLSVTGYSMQRQTDPSLSNNLRKKVLLLALPNPAMRCAVRQGMLAASDLPLMEKLGQLAFPEEPPIWACSYHQSNCFFLIGGPRRR